LDAPSSETVVTAAWLHDIGHAPGVRDTGFHAPSRWAQRHSTVWPARTTRKACGRNGSPDTAPKEVGGTCGSTPETRRAAAAQATLERATPVEHPDVEHTFWEAVMANAPPDDTEEDTERHAIELVGASNRAAA
jgi:hypothetical protein